jgi:hypothetical protein
VPHLSALFAEGWDDDHSVIWCPMSPGSGDMGSLKFSRRNLQRIMPEYATLKSAEKKKARFERTGPFRIQIRSIQAPKNAEEPISVSKSRN